MRVVHVLNELRPSGMERMLHSAAAEFNNSSIHSVIVGQGTVHPFAGALRDAGYDVRLIPNGRSLRGAIEFSKLIRELRPTVVHIHSESTYPIDAWIARIASRQVGIVRTVHSFFDYGGLRGRLRRLYNLLGDQASDVITVPTEELRGHESWRESVLVSPNWADPRFAECVRSVDPNARPSVLFVGNCSPIKNHTQILRLIHEHTTLDVVHLGAEEGAQREELEVLDRLTQDGRLVKRGATDPLPYMERAAVFAMPSILEGMGVALLEALSARMPAIISDAQGLAWARELDGVFTAMSDADWLEALACATTVTLPPRPHGHFPYSMTDGVTSIKRAYVKSLQYRGDLNGSSGGMK